MPASAVVPVADHHDPFGGVFGKGGLGQLDGGGEIRVLAVHPGLHFGDLHVVVERRNLDIGLASEDDHTHPVVSPAVPDDGPVHVAKHCLALCFGDAPGLVQEVDHREPVADPHDLHFGQCQDQERQQEASQRDHDRAPYSAQQRELPKAEPPQPGYQGQQCQICGRSDRDVVIEHVLHRRADSTADGP